MTPQETFVTDFAANARAPACPSTRSLIRFASSPRSSRRSKPTICPSGRRVCIRARGYARMRLPWTWIRSTRSTNSADCFRRATGGPETPFRRSPPSSRHPPNTRRARASRGAPRDRPAASGEARVACLRHAAGPRVVDAADSEWHPSSASAALRGRRNGRNQGSGVRNQG